LEERIFLLENKISDFKTRGEFYTLARGVVENRNRGVFPSCFS